MDCWDITNLIQHKNNINNAMQTFGSSQFQPSHINLRQIPDEIKTFNNDLKNMKIMKENINEIRDNCSKESGWEKWFDGQDSVKDINNKLDRAIKNLEDFLHLELEKNSQMKIPRSDSAKGSLHRKKTKKKHKSKKHKHKSNKRNKERKRKRSRKMKAGNIYNLLRKREQGSTRGIHKKGIARSFLARTDGRQARINTIPPEIKSEIPEAIGMAAIRIRPKRPNKPISFRR